MTPLRQCLYPLRRVIIYKGHETNPLLGPYPANIQKRIQMFTLLNDYRKKCDLPEWEITVTPGEKLVSALKDSDPEDTLLVIPAGQSTNLDKVFSLEETSFIKKDFFEKGGRGYLTCGSAYWTSRTRIYQGLCTESPETYKTLVKISNLPLFEGIAQGPLCPFPGKKYEVGFFSDAVNISAEKELCTLYLSGGGYFLPEKISSQKIKVLARYPHEELIRLGKSKEECSQMDKAVLMASVGKGIALMAMFHPYYGENDIDVERYEKHFPDSGTNWKAVKEALSPLDVRMRFVLHKMLGPLENRDWR